MCWLSTFLTLLCCSTTLVLASASHSRHHRRILHQPFFPQPSLSPTQAPFFSPQPKLPFSFSSSSTSPTHKSLSFFPSYHSPPSPTTKTLSTFPANISSLLFPHPSSSSSNHRPSVIAVAVSVSLISALLIAALTAFVYFHRRRKYSKASKSDSIRLYPPNIPTSDATLNTRSPEILYLGTLVNSRDEIAENSTNAGVPYQILGSPELKPLPPLPRYNLGHNGEEEDEEFFSPRGSSGRKESIVFVDDFGNGRSFNSRTNNSASPTNSVSNKSSPVLNLSPISLNPKSPSRPLPPEPISSPPAPPPPPPPPPPGFWEIRVPAKLIREPNTGPPLLIAPSISVLHNDESPKPKLKPLLWDKVRASSERAMVWDQLKPSTFQLRFILKFLIFDTKGKEG